MSGQERESAIRAALRRRGVRRARTAARARETAVATEQALREMADVLAAQRAGRPTSSPLPPDQAAELAEAYRQAHEVARGDVLAWNVQWDITPHTPHVQASEELREACAALLARPFVSLSAAEWAEAAGAVQPLLVLRHPLAPPTPELLAAEASASLEAAVEALRAARPLAPCALVRGEAVALVVEDPTGGADPHSYEYRRYEDCALHLLLTRALVEEGWFEELPDGLLRPLPRRDRKDLERRALDLPQVRPPADRP